MKLKVQWNVGLCLSRFATDSGPGTTLKGTFVQCLTTLHAQHSEGTTCLQFFRELHLYESIAKSA